MEIVDAHMHFWTPETHPWVAKVKDGGHPAGAFDKVQHYTAQEYQKDIAGHNITQVVHVQAEWPGDPYGETMWLDGIAESNPSGIPHAIVAGADLSDVNVEEVFRRHCQSKRVRGIRQLLNFHPTKPQYSEQKHDNFLTDPQWQSGYALLEKYSLSFDLHILSGQMQRSADLVRKFPHIPVMLNHCGVPYERDEVAMKIWKEGLTELASCPNVYCKISGVFSTDPQWSSESVASVVLPCIELFGMDRCVFASNFPVCKVNGTYSQLVDTITNIVEPFSQEQKKKLFAENAKKFYHL